MLVLRRYVDNLDLLPFYQLPQKMVPYVYVRRIGIGDRTLCDLNGTLDTLFFDCLQSVFEESLHSPQSFSRPPKCTPCRGCIPQSGGCILLDLPPLTRKLRCAARAVNSDGG